MKVVLNKCYGGFGLSPKAVKRYAEIKGEPCFFFEVVKNHYVEKTIEEVDASWNWVAFKVNNPNEMLGGKKWNYNKYKELTWNLTNYEDLDRSDPTLVQVVEELGEEASAKCAKLEVEELNMPSINSLIQDYDGMETINWR